MTEFSTFFLFLLTAISTESTLDSQAIVRRYVRRKVDVALHSVNALFVERRKLHNCTALERAALWKSKDREGSQGLRRALCCAVVPAVHLQLKVKPLLYVELSDMGRRGARPHDERMSRRSGERVSRSSNTDATHSDATRTDTADPDAAHTGGVAEARGCGDTIQAPPNMRGLSAGRNAWSEDVLPTRCRRFD